MKKRSKTAPKVDPFLEGLMGKLLDRLNALEKKMDVVISRTAGKSSGASGPARPHEAPAAQPPRRERTLYEAICADCSKVCEVPFQPTENRPVYCKACWAKRRGERHGMPVLTPVALPPKPVSKLGLAPKAPPPPPAPPKKAKKKAPAKKAKKKSKR